MRQNVMGKLKNLPKFIKENIIAIIVAVVIGRFGYCIIDDHFDVTNKMAKLMGYFFVFLFIVMMSYVYLHREGIKDRLHKLYLFVGLIVGCMYLIMIPIFCVPDELFHFKDAYHVSNEMMGIHDPDDDTLTMRVCDTKMKMNRTEYDNPIQYARYIRSIFSGIIDNIPYTATMAPMIATIEQTLGHTYVHPLWWSLALGACLGGNMTIIGAAANVIVSENAHKAGYPISFLKFLKYGILVTFISLSVSTVYIYFRFLIHS